jgi:hypothetical protein
MRKLKIKKITKGTKPGASQNPENESCKKRMK